MKKVILAVLVALASTLLLVMPVHATTPPVYNLIGTWTFNDIWQGVPYPSTWTINSFNPATGAFSGTGIYIAGGVQQTITGTEDGNTIDFFLTGTDGVTINAVGTISSSTYISGTGQQSNVGTIDWTAVKDITVTPVPEVPLGTIVSVATITMAALAYIGIVQWRKDRKQIAVA